MNTFLKALLLLALVAMAFYICPILFAPLGLIVGLATLVGGLLGTVLMAIAGVGATALGVVLSAVLLVVLALAPLWIPILLIYGLVRLNRGSKTPPANVVAV